ncbi:MAG: YceI family protein [Saprospiraceae bacterium]|nr:YceI family protein [Saprospiraceae bacterium]
MKIKILAAAILMISAFSVDAQRYFTREAKIDFISDAPMEQIEAHNSSATTVLDISNGQLEFAVLIKAFLFEKALMQEHFNENYMESDKFPKANFKGNIQNPEAVKWGVDGTYPIEVSGKMTIHGVTRDVTAPGTIVISGGAVSASSSFAIAVADYDIEIPSVVREKIAKEVAINVNVNFQELK